MHNLPRSHSLPESLQAGNKHLTCNSPFRKFLKTNILMESNRTIHYLRKLLTGYLSDYYIQ